MPRLAKGRTLRQSIKLFGRGGEYDAIDPGNWWSGQYRQCPHSRVGQATSDPGGRR
ncbi:hypothetical protein BQ8794_50044 [Mesorhizobium prunaredense]|uniref:Uncharacterized protein n=1 Tax=Mesorhizobium prunaredense TaxID=1631249 RepID=A0A1R3VDB8_9HYPH|nr:hypothetical protein BQ8794_50044 [Mesorhizobium prunaredense]